MWAAAAAAAGVGEDRIGTGTGTGREAATRGGWGGWAAHWLVNEEEDAVAVGVVGAAAGGFALGCWSRASRSTVAHASA